MHKVAIIGAVLMICGLIMLTSVCLYIVFEKSTILGSIILSILLIVLGGMLMQMYVDLKK